MTKLRLPLIAGALAALAACTGSPPPPPPPTQAEVQAAQAAEKLKMYEQLRTTERYDLAADIGGDIVAKFPNTPAAGEVNKTLPGVKEKVAAVAEARRIAKLWIYNQVKEPKGVQYTASTLAVGSPAQEGPDRVRLVLRQHPDWGQSVYLLRDEGGFKCPSPCNLTVQFDDKPAEKLPGTVPPTGEPAIFIDPDVAFIAKLAQAKKVSIDTEWKDRGKRTLEFEVSGLDVSRLPNAPKKK